MTLLLLACVTTTGTFKGDSAPGDSAGESAESAPDTDPGVDTSPPEDSTGETADSNGETADASTDTQDTAPEAPPSAEDCFAEIWDGRAPVDYDQFGPVLNSACRATNHQDISGVERVVFIGDSITVGTPPTAADDWWRNQVADDMVTRYGLEAPAWEWENVDLLEGMTYVMESGDFASCAKWGARTDDVLQEPHQQLETCIPEEQRHLRTLIFMTVGGNDIYSLLEDVNAGVDEATLRSTFQDAVELLRESVAWVVEPGRFPNGAWIVFANLYDFSDQDGAAEMSECPGAQLIGMDAPLQDPVLQSILGDANEQYLAIAVETQTDMVFMGEHFCGYGYNSADTSSRCYRGGGAPLYFDFTCEHPSADGHDALTALMLSAVDE